MQRLARFLDKTLDTRVSPQSYLFVLTGIVTGFAFCFLHTVSKGVQNSILYQEGALIGVSLWGAILFGGSLITLAGMALRYTTTTMIGSFLGFTSWTFAAIVYLMNGDIHWLFPLAILSVLSFGYIFLAAALGRLWDYTPRRKD